MAEARVVDTFEYRTDPEVRAMCDRAARASGLPDASRVKRPMVFHEDRVEFETFLEGHWSGETPTISTVVPWPLPEEG